MSFQSDDSDTYGSYLVNFFHAYQVFDKIYNERAQEMYGVGFYDIDRKTGEGQVQYNAIRKGVPHNILVVAQD